MWGLPCPAGGSETSATLVFSAAAFKAAKSISFSLKLLHQSKKEQQLIMNGWFEIHFTPRSEEAERFRRHRVGAFKLICLSSKKEKDNRKESYSVSVWMKVNSDCHQTSFALLSQHVAIGDLTVPPALLDPGLAPTANSVISCSSTTVLNKERPSCVCGRGGRVLDSVSGEICQKHWGCSLRRTVPSD